MSFDLVFIQISIFCYYLPNGAEVMQLGFICLEMATHSLYLVLMVHLKW